MVRQRNPGLQSTQRRDQLEGRTLSCLVLQLAAVKFNRPGVVQGYQGRDHRRSRLI
jgi:hypothetical protein